MKIIITGSLGNISQPLAQELVKTGHQTVVISSNPGKRTAIEALGASAAIGSLSDPGFLSDVFKDADAVYTMIPPDFTTADPLAHYGLIGRSYTRAIRISGIRRVVQLSSWGAHLPAGTGVIMGSYRVEELFNELSDTVITYLRPCSFYNNLYHYMDMIKTSGFIGTNYGGDDKVVWVSPKDIAAAAAEELVLSPQENTVRYIASDERTCSDVARVLGEAIGRPDLQWLTFSDAQVKETIEKSGVPAPMATLLVELNAAIRTGLMRQDYDLHQPVMGKVKLEDFAREFATAFK